MSTGNIFRQFAADAGMNLYDFENSVAKKDLNFDKKLDAQTQKYGEENEDFIFESRLAWHFIPDSFKIFLDCESDERYRRIHKREG
jgi:cytidylate kinase